MALLPGGFFGGGGGLGMPQSQNPFPPTPGALLGGQQSGAGMGFRDPRALMMLASILGGAQQGPQGIAQNAMGTMQFFNQIEDRAARNKMQKELMELRRGEAERQEKRFEFDVESAERELEREEQSRKAKMDFISKFTQQNGGMGSRQGGADAGQGVAGSVPSANGGMSGGLISSMLQVPEYQDKAVTEMLRRSRPAEPPTPTSLTRNIEAMSSLPPGDPRRAIYEQSLTKPQVSISQGPQAPKLPSNYMWKTPEDPAASGYAVVPLPGSKPTKRAASEAGKISMLKVARDSIKSARSKIFDEEGNVNRGTLAASYYNIPRTQGSIARSQIEDAIDAKLRMETGAQATQGEIDRLVERFITPPWEGEEAIKETFTTMESFLSTALQETDPELYEELTGRSGQAPQDAQEEMPVYRMRGGNLERVR